MSKITHIFFDLDGTLLDTGPDLALALNKTLKHRGQKSVPYKKFRYKIYGGSNTMVSYGFDMPVEHPDFELIKAEFLQNYRDNIAQETQFFPGMEEVLHHLNNNKIDWGIITNKPSWLTDPLLKHFDLTNTSQCIISGDTLEKRKPNPDQLHHACEILSCKPKHSIYLGDVQGDITAAKSAGMRAVGVTYGYHQENSPPHKWGADHLIGKPGELIEWLEN